MGMPALSHACVRLRMRSYMRTHMHAYGVPRALRALRFTPSDLSQCPAQRIHHLP